MSKRITASLNFLSPEDDRIIKHYQNASSRKGRSELLYLLKLGAIVKESGVGDLLIALDKQAGPDHAVACISKVKSTIDESLIAITREEPVATSDPEPRIPEVETSELDAGHPFFPKPR